MANVTQIPAPRVELIDPRTGLMSREWFRFFNNLYVLTGGGTTDTSLADLQLAPVYQLTSPDATAADLAPQTVTVAEPQFDLSPRYELGTLASQNADNITFGNLTVSGTATFSAGTANGVAYLNASKVFTTGTALTFDGTNLGIGTITPANPLTVTSDTVAQVRVGTVSANINARITLASSGTGINILGTNGVTDLAFYSGGTEQLRLTTAGNLTFSVGNLVQGTAAKGVNFTANTPLAGMTSQLLNWYEDGAYTPTVTAGSGSITSYSATAKYTRIGRQVTVCFEVTISNNGTGATSLIVTLPFTCGSQPSIGVGRENGSTGNILQAYVGASASTAIVLTATNGYPGASGYKPTCTVTYFV